MTKGENRHARTDLYTRARADADARTRHAREMMAHAPRNARSQLKISSCALAPSQSTTHSRMHTFTLPPI